MPFDRQATGLAITRIFLGVYLLCLGAGKYRWIADSSILATTLNRWLQAAPSASVSRWYLDHVAVPGVAAFARLVPIGEVSCGLALIAGFWTPLAALVAFLMVLNFHIASGDIFKFSFLTDPTGLPVLGPALGLALMVPSGRKYRT